MCRLAGPTRPGRPYPAAPSACSPNRCERAATSRWTRRRTDPDTGRFRRLSREQRDPATHTPAAATPASPPTPSRGTGGCSAGWNRSCDGDRGRPAAHRGRTMAAAIALRSRHPAAPAVDDTRARGSPRRRRRQAVPTHACSTSTPPPAPTGPTDPWQRHDAVSTPAPRTRAAPRGRPPAFSSGPADPPRIHG
jgi:hypothetical protein